MTDTDGLREKLARQGEDALGKLAQDLLENPFITGAISRAFEAREKASAAQEAAMGALNLPSAADLERLTRRLRSVSQRLEGIEDSLDRLDQKLEDMVRRANGATKLEDRLDKINAELHSLANAVDTRPAPVPREQERLDVETQANAAAAVEKTVAKRAGQSKASGAKPGASKPAAKKPAASRPAAKKPAASRPAAKKPAAAK
jgi:chromosome segregation ATPase